jgi:hypothetical protein
VSQGISESYLRWRGIEATLMLAQSPNAKIVVIGSGKDGLPIILNAEPNAPGAPPQSPGGGSASSGTSSSGSSSSETSPGASANTPPPAPATNAPPNASSEPGATPGSPGGSPAGSPGSPANKPPRGTSGAATPTAPDETANAGPVIMAQPEKTITSATALDIPGVRSILSGISGVLRAGADLTTPEPKSKQ